MTLSAGRRLGCSRRMHRYDGGHADMDGMTNGCAGWNGVISPGVLSRGGVSEVSVTARQPLLDRILALAGQPGAGAPRTCIARGVGLLHIRASDWSPGPGASSVSVALMSKRCPSRPTTAHHMMVWPVTGRSPQTASQRRYFGSRKKPSGPALCLVLPDWDRCRCDALPRWC